MNTAATKPAFTVAMSRAMAMVNATLLKWTKYIATVSTVPPKRMPPTIRYFLMVFWMYSGELWSSCACPWSQASPGPWEWEWSWLMCG